MLEVVKFLVEEAGANRSPRDRWGAPRSTMEAADKRRAAVPQSKGATVSKAAAESSACNLVTMEVTITA